MPLAFHTSGGPAAGHCGAEPCLAGQAVAVGPRQPGHSGEPGTQVGKRHEGEGGRDGSERSCFMCSLL